MERHESFDEEEEDEDDEEEMWYNMNLVNFLGKERIMKNMRCFLVKFARNQPKDFAKVVKNTTVQSNAS
jgi:hypothetical protein